MTSRQSGRDGGPRLARVELVIIDQGVLGGYRWRYRLTRWIHRWLYNGWRNRDGDPVCHWATLWSMSVQRKVEWVATSGHEG